MLKTFLLLLLAAILGLVAYAAILPSEFRIVRVGKIGAPQATVFESVNNLRTWQEWSPWAKLDPNAKTSFDGPQSGVNASFSWSGNSDVGEGKMTIVESRPNEAIKMRLDFTKPMQANNIAEFTFKPDADGTEMTWAMSGTNNILGRVMCLVFNADRMVGRQFEQGFANLNALAASKK